MATKPAPKVPAKKKAAPKKKAAAKKPQIKYGKIKRVEEKMTAAQAAKIIKKKAPAATSGQNVRDAAYGMSGKKYKF